MTARKKAATRSVTRSGTKSGRIASRAATEATGAQTVRGTHPAPHLERSTTHDMAGVPLTPVQRGQRLIDEGTAIVKHNKRGAAAAKKHAREVKAATAAGRPAFGANLMNRNESAVAAPTMLVGRGMTPRAGKGAPAPHIAMLSSSPPVAVHGGRVVATGEDASRLLNDSLNAQFEEAAKRRAEPRPPVTAKRGRKAAGKATKRGKK
jgi:hypothetical protein